MAIKNTIINKKCPECGFTYSSYTDKGRIPLSVKYDSPVKKCKNCKAIFVDPSVREIAISGVDKDDCKMFTRDRIIAIAFFAIFGALLLLKADEYGFFSVLFFIFAGVVLLASLISYKPKQNKIKRLTMESEKRTSNTKYISLLASLGYPIPKSYFEKNNLLHLYNEVESNNDKEEINVQSIISDIKPNKNQHKCQACGNIQSKAIQRCLNCSSLINDNATEDFLAEINFDLDMFMTGQLVAFYKATHEDKYSKEYERRLMQIGFTTDEAKSLFMLELMILKHDSIAILTENDYIINNYFDLKSVKFPMEASYYVEHQSFLVSEVTKIWDEAEYDWANYRNAEMASDVLDEIFKISRYGGGELLIKTLKGISKSSNVSYDKIVKYSNKEQDLIFKYKWNKEGNEPHPYH